MADNYLEKRMEEYRAGKLSRPVSHHVRSTPSSPFEGLRVYITRGTTPIGQALIKAFRAKGCRVAFCDDNPRAGAAVAQATGSQFHPLDLNDPGAVERSMKTVVGRWGGIDVLINTDPDTVETTSAIFISLLGDARQENQTVRIININQSDQAITRSMSAQLTIPGATVNSITLPQHDNATTPDDVAHASLLLAHPRSTCINGITLPLS